MMEPAKEMRSENYFVTHHLLVKKYFSFFSTAAILDHNELVQAVNEILNTKEDMDEDARDKLGDEIDKKIRVGNSVR